MACRDCDQWKREAHGLPWGSCELLSSTEKDTEADSLVSGIMCVCSEGRYMGAIVFTHALFCCVNEGDAVTKEARETHRRAYRQVVKLGDAAPPALVDQARMFRFGRNG